MIDLKFNAMSADGFILRSERQTPLGVDYINLLYEELSTDNNYIDFIILGEEKDD